MNDSFKRFLLDDISHRMCVYCRTYVIQVNKTKNTH